MLTITYRGPTNTKGARMECRGDQGKVVIPWNYSVDARPNAEAAVRAYLAKVEKAMGGTWCIAEAAGHLPCGWVAVRLGTYGDAPGRFVTPWEVQVRA